MTREIRLTFILIPVLWIVGVPVGAYFDAGLTVNPETQNLTTIGTDATSPGFWDYFWVFVKINSWEMFMVTAGAAVGILTWERKVKI